MGEGSDAEHASATHAPFSSVSLWLLTLGSGLLAVLLIRLRRSTDPDLWLHLRIGQELLAGERFQRLPDPLTVLADRAYSPTQWLAEVVMSLVHDVSGVGGIHALRALAVALLLVFLQLTAATYTTSVRAAAVALPALAATAAQWAERPQLGGVVLMAVTTWLWSRSRRDLTTPWLVVPLTWGWAMVHGSWILGVGTGALFILAMLLEAPRRPRPWARLAGVVLATVVVVTLTPLGAGLLRDPFVVGTAARGGVNEWAAPSLANPLVLIVLGMAAVVVVRSVQDFRARLPELLIAFSAVGLATITVRTIAFGAVLMVPALAAVTAPRQSDAPTRRGRVSPWPLMAMTVGLLLAPGVVISAPSAGPLPTSIDSAVKQLPSRAVVAVEPAASGWVLYEHPEVQLLRDLRAEVYSAPVARAYESFLRAEPGWQVYAKKHGVTALVLADGSELDRAARTDAGWRQVARAGDHVVWQRAG